jgi:hypothetical protein
VIGQADFDDLAQLVGWLAQYFQRNAHVQA